MPKVASLLQESGDLGSASQRILQRFWGSQLAQVCIGDAQVDFAARVIECGGRTASVEPKVMAVLHLMMQRAGEAITREDLIKNIWDVRFGGDERLSRAISILRHAMGDSAGKQCCIETIPKHGYRLVAEIGDVAAPQKPAEVIAQAKPAVSPHSVAVLPFDVMTASGDQQYIGDGISEEIINALAHVDDLHVAGRISTFALARAELSLEDIAAKLNVAFVVEGSVRQSGEVTRITAQLICADDGFHRWSEEFDGNANDLFGLYGRVAKSSVVNISRALDLVHGKDHPESPIRDQDLFEMFLEGRAATHQRDGESSLPMAIDLLGQVVERDPTFPEAWAFLAIAHYFMLEYQHTPDWREHLKQAQLATSKAVALAPDAPTTTVPRLFAAAHDGRLDAHAKLVEALSERMPGQSLAEFHLSTILVGCGLMRQGLEHLEHAMQVEPMSHAGNSLLSSARHILGDVEDPESAYIEAFGNGVLPAGLIVAWLMTDRAKQAEALDFLEKHFAKLTPLLANLFGSEVTFARISRAIIDRDDEARDQLAEAMRQRIEAGEVQPNSGALLVPIMIGRPKLFMQAARHVSTTYLPGALVHLWGNTREAHELRAHPDFPAFAKELGMPEVWEKFGWPEAIDRAQFQAVT
uniref:winged helix-turn-helix domain-containing protein n=1 Tax=uncultured Altererythrobacter sp. TaxID=500840 RepID=UPI002604B77D|nr:winged helix-turn-helix domain-containing protein [uncultured Altererythrobacter sp.]